VRFRRYQLDKTSLHALDAGHPWIFRRRLSSAATVFSDGDKLKLVDGENRIVGYGIYEAEGAIAIRILSRGSPPPAAAWVQRQVDAALEHRRALRQTTNAMRILHGENDGLPAVALDVYGRVGVLQTYSGGMDAIGRLAARLVRERLELEAVVWKPARRRRTSAHGPSEPRVLSGRTPGLVKFREHDIELTVDPMAGQKSGTFLDLRGLRRWVAATDRSGTRVLNLFSYTGGFALAAEAAGATEVWNVDSSHSALDFGAAHHTRDPSRHRWIAADVFNWIRTLSAEETFDLVIVDPPLMTSQRSGVPRALAAYTRLYRAAREHVRSGGSLIACCCTSRITPSAFRSCLDRALGSAFSFVERLAPEPDHPVAFAEADYLKILVYRSATTPRNATPDSSAIPRGS
jgi:23S rRNA (cytosine1962-C5)-methyltransferase